MIGRSGNTGRRSRQRGFTLAEVVVGALIFGLAAAVLGQAVSDALRSHLLSRAGESLDYPLYRVRNHILALPSREAVEEGGEIEVPVALRDSAEETDRTVLVRARWEAEAFPTRLLDLFVVETLVTIEGEEADAAKREIALTAYRPSWSDPDETERLVEAKEEEFADRLLARGIGEGEEEAE